jgi:polyphosphate kinase
LDKRVEVLISLKDSSVIKQIKWIIKVFKEDRKNSFVMDSDGKWKHSDGDFDAHDWFIQYSDIKKKKKKWNK